MNKLSVLFVLLLFSTLPLVAQPSYAVEDTGGNIGYSYQHLTETFTSRSSEKSATYEDRIYISYQGDAKALMGLSLGKIGHKSLGLYFSIWGSPASFVTRADEKIQAKDIGEYSTTQRMFTGANRRTERRLSIGLTKRIYWDLWAYAGLGTSATNKYLKTEDFEKESTYWVKIQDQSRQSLLAEAGLIFLYKGMTIKTGAAYVQPNNWLLSFGLGFSLKMR